MVTLRQCAGKLETYEAREAVNRTVDKWLDDIITFPEDTQSQSLIKVLEVLYPRIKPPATALKQMLVLDRYDLKAIRVEGMPAMKDCPLFQEIATRSKSSKCSQVSTWKR
jgi:hypothetical protein